MLTFFLSWMWRNKPDNSPIPKEQWRVLFEHAMYTEDHVVRPRPPRTYRAYRGATAENRYGLSWSLDVAQAEYFARSRQAPGISTARVWVTNIPADHVFARFIDGCENEVTADVRDLDVRPIEEEGELPRLRRSVFRRGWFWLSSSMQGV